MDEDEQDEELTPLLRRMLEEATRLDAIVEDTHQGNRNKHAKAKAAAERGGFLTALGMILQAMEPHESEDWEEGESRQTARLAGQEFLLKSRAAP